MPLLSFERRDLSENLRWVREEEEEDPQGLKRAQTAKPSPTQMYANQLALSGLAGSFIRETHGAIRACDWLPRFPDVTSILGTLNSSR